MDGSSNYRRHGHNPERRCIANADLHADSDSHANSNADTCLHPAAVRVS